MGEKSTATSRRLLLLIACLLVHVESWVSSFSNGATSRIPMTRGQDTFQRIRPPRGGGTGSASSRGLTLSAAPTVEAVSLKLGKGRCHVSASRPLDV